MSTDAAYMAYLHDQIGLGPALSSRRMFGEYALYLDGKVVGLVCDRQLFLKPTDAVRALWPEPVTAFPFPGAKPWLLADAWLDEPDMLRRLLRVTADALPLPAPKKKRPSGSNTGKPSPMTARRTD